MEESLLNQQPRDDYREFLELVLIFLGATPTSGIRFMTPGPMHRARWMAKAIYAITVYLFKGRLILTAKEKYGLQKLCLFIALVYVKCWYNAPKGVCAPRNDIEFIQILADYKKVLKDVADAAMSKCSSHLWYLSEELVMFALFDDGVAAETKV